MHPRTHYGKTRFVRRRIRPTTTTTTLWATVSTTDSTTTDAADANDSDNQQQRQPPPPHEDFTTPLPFHTFAGQVEQAIKDNFGDPNGSEKNVERVLHCWRRLEADCEYKASVRHLLLLSSSDKNNVAAPPNHKPKEHPNDPTTTVTTTTTPNEQTPVVVVTQTPDNLQYQHCHSYVPGLTIHEFWDITHVDWALRLQHNFGDAIRDEFRRHVTQASRAQQQRLHQEGNNIWSGALTDEAATNYGTGWKTLVLMDRGVWDDRNVHLFPVTAQAVRDAGVPAVEVFFASMDPHSEIPTHSDSTNFVLTCHLGLEIPEPTTPTSVGCQLRVGNQVRSWRNGHVLLLDTSLLHNAVNDTPQTRYILMMRVWHPELTLVERQALQFIWDCLETPSLAQRTMQQYTPSAMERQAWLDQAQARRAFPTLAKKETAAAVPSSRYDATAHHRKGFGGGMGTTTPGKRQGQPKKSKAKGSKK
ncbi:hypothetical protein ACA910_003697 [Epithemia clementina (nom. ined.)]